MFKMAKTGVGVTVIRKEACDKVTGDAKYTDDFMSVGTMTARTAVSTCAHGKIIKLDTSAAAAVPGVRAVLTGESVSALYGSVIEDSPLLAREKVRYYGEPVALVVAETEFQAAKAAALIRADYEPLPVVQSPSQAMRPGAPLVHEKLGEYQTPVQDVYPEPGTNVCDRELIRKGDVQKGFSESDVVVEGRYVLPQSDHIAMEARSAQASITADGTVLIRTSSQSPFEVQKTISKLFSLDEGRVIVETPLVGGGFGGKAPVQLELLAYLASRAVGGRSVRITNTREEDIVSSPCRMGLEATVKLGATKDGMLRAAAMTYLVETGAYADIGPRLTKAVIADCTGPYNIDHVSCDALCVYTNHPYATSFRGFSHASSAFCVERTMDKLARRLGTDPAELRIKNALVPDQTSPTQVKITRSNYGDLQACIDRLKNLVNWGEGDRLELGGKQIRAKANGVLLEEVQLPDRCGFRRLHRFLNSRRQRNLIVGCVELGPMMKTTAAQLLSEALKMDINRIHVNMDVSTKYAPRHWKPGASMTTYMLGRAVLAAADDAVRQLKSIAAAAMKCVPEELDLAEERVYLKSDPSVFHMFADLVHGHQYDNGNTIGGQVLGRGGFVMHDLNFLNKETGKENRGRTGRSVRRPLRSNTIQGSTRTGS
jgi:CO/xanthine dehydrogenase Mo-binding subunit